MKLLLIDKRVRSKELVNARNEETDYIEFDYFLDTYASITDRIKELANDTRITDIAVVQHGNLVGAYFILQQQLPLTNSANDLRDWLVELKSVVGLQRFDLLGCALYSNSEIREAIQWLEETTQIDLRASINFTGNAMAGGDWVMESDNVDIRANYFTDGIINFSGLFFSFTNSSMYGANKLIRDVNGNVVYLHKDIYGNPINPPTDLSGRGLKYPIGSLVAWGYIAYTSNDTNFIAIYSTQAAFAALKSDGSVVTWGDVNYGGNINHSQNGIKFGNVNSGVVAIYSTQVAFAALKSDGSVVTWGLANAGGNSNYPENPLKTGNVNSGVDAIYSTQAAFAALKSDGSVVTWGQPSYGGDIYDSQNGIKSGDVSSGVVAIYSTQSAFAALKSDGSVVTWGASYAGGSTNDFQFGIKTGDINSEVVAIYSTQAAFAALKSDGSVVTWGDVNYGGNINDSQNGIKTGNVNSGVVAIYSTQGAFAALKSDGSVVTWGQPSYGGDTYDSYNGIKSGDVSSGVVAIYSTQAAFAALKYDGSVVTWGPIFSGGNVNDSEYGIKTGVVSSGVVAIYSNYYAFAALKLDGSVITWGMSFYGGDVNHSQNGIKSGNVNSGVVAIYSTQAAFAALKSDGSVVSWGPSSSGGNVNDSQYGIKTGDVSSNILSIYSSAAAFAALKPSDQVNLSKYYLPTGATNLDAFKLTTSLFSTKNIININETANIFPINSNGFGTYSMVVYETIPGQPTRNISESTPLYISISNEIIRITNPSVFKRSTDVQYNIIISDSDLPPQQAEAITTITFVGYETNADLTTTITFQGSNILTATSPQTDFTLGFNNESCTIQVDASGGSRPVKYTLINSDTLQTINEITSNLNRYTYQFKNNYDYTSETTINYKVSADDGATTIPILFTITYLPYIPLTSPSSMTSTILYVIPPNSTTLKVMNVSGGTPSYYYTWYGEDYNTSEPVILQSETINGLNSPEFEITAEDSLAFAGSTHRYYCVISDSRTPNPQTITANYIVNFIFNELEYEIIPYKNDIQIPLTNSYELNYTNESLRFEIDISSGVSPYSIKLVEKLNAFGDELLIYSDPENDLSFTLTNSYLFVGDDRPKSYEIYIADRSQPKQEKFYRFNLTYKAYKPITASQNFTAQTIAMNASLSMEPLNVSGGKSGIYSYTWYASQQLTGLDAFNKLSATDLSFNLYAINDGPLTITNSPPFTEGVQTTYFYKCIITDRLNTTPIELYFKVLFDTYYAAEPCIDGEVEVHTTDGLVKVKNLTTAHLLLNLKNGGEFPIFAIYVKEISGNFYNIPFGQETELYSSGAIINTTSLLYEFIPTSSYSQYVLPSPQPRRLMYHIFTNQFIKSDIFTKNGLQLKSYGSPTTAEKNFFPYDELLNGYYLTYLFSDTLPDKDLSTGL